MTRRLVWLCAGLLGVGLAILATLTGLLALVLALVGTMTSDPTGRMMVAGTVAIGLGLGVPLAICGWSGWHDQPSRPFTPSHSWWGVLVWVVLVGVGAALSVLPPALRGWLLLPVHVAAMSVPSLTVLWWVGSKMKGAGGSRREVVAGLASGGLIGTAIALFAEGIAALVLVLGIAVALSVIPGGTEKAMSLAQMLGDPTLLSDPGRLAQLLFSPWVVLSVLGFVTLPVPLLEEATKTLTVGIFGARLRPEPARGFFWGVAGGAGFAMAENLLNGAVGGEAGWVTVAMARAAATLMHCATGGLVGWGWAQLWTARRPLRFVAAYALSVLCHGLWNAAAIGAALMGVAAEVYRGIGWSEGLISLGVGVLAGFLVLAAIILMIALGRAGRTLGEREGSSTGNAGVADIGEGSRRPGAEVTAVDVV